MQFLWILSTLHRSSNWMRDIPSLWHTYQTMLALDAIVWRDYAKNLKTHEMRPWSMSPGLDATKNSPVLNILNTKIPYTTTGNSYEAYSPFTLAFVTVPARFGTVLLGLTSLCERGPNRSVLRWPCQQGSVRFGSIRFDFVV